MATYETDGVDLAAAQQRYSTGAVVLHWLIALALAFQLALGFSMPHDQRGFTLFQLHKSVGITILLLSVARLVWRWTHRPPPAVEGGPLGLLAKVVHYGLYAFMILGPLTGWAIVSTARVKIPTVLFGVVPWPHLPLPSSLGEPMEGIHEVIAWIGIALFVLHVAGAIRHQVLIKDGLLRRMAPAGNALWVWLLAALVLAVYFGTGTRIASWVVATGGYPPEEGERRASPAASTPASGSPAGAAVLPGGQATPAPETSPTPEATDTGTAADTLAAAPTPAGPPAVWSITGGKRLGFSVDNGGSTISGTFKDWAGSIVMDPDHPETAQLRITVELASAAIGDATQDGMLQGAEFFASGANPRATWRSTSVTQTSPGHYRANGTLSLKGVSKPQVVTFALSGKDLKRHVTGNATINRSAFGIGTGESAAGLAKSVALNFAFDAAGKVP